MNEDDTVYVVMHGDVWPLNLSSVRVYATEALARADCMAGRTFLECPVIRGCPTCGCPRGVHAGWKIEAAGGGDSAAPKGAGGRRDDGGRSFVEWRSRAEGGRH